MTNLYIGDKLTNQVDEQKATDKSNETRHNILYEGITPDMEIELLSVDEVSNLINYHRSTVYKFINRGELTSIKKHRRRLVSKADLYRFVLKLKGEDDA